MKKIMYIFVLFCILLSGCSNMIKETKFLKVGPYSNEKAMFYREFTNPKFKVEMECENYNTEPTITHRFYRSEEEVDIEEGVLLKDIRMEYGKNKDILYLYEHVYYYDEEDAENNFAYNQVSKILLQSGSSDKSITHVKCAYTKNFRWEIAEVFKALGYSFKTGVYNPVILYVLYTYATIVIGGVLALLIIYHMMKHSITREKDTKLKVFDAILVVTFVLVYLVDYSDYVPLTRSFFDVRMLDAILKTLLLVELAIRLGICITVKNKWNKKQITQ